MKLNIKLIRHLLVNIFWLGKFIALAGVIVLTVFQFGITGSVEISAQGTDPDDENITYVFLPACEFADTSTAALTECLSEIVSYIFFIAIVIFFVRVAYIAIISVSSPGNRQTFKEIKDSIYGLVVGMFFVGMPVTIMALINPTSQLITFNIVEEFSFGPEANLINVTPNATGCISFTNCIRTCRNSKPPGDGPGQINECVANCKSDFPDCEDCHDLAGENGLGINTEEYRNCVAPTGVSGGRRESNIATKSATADVTCGGVVCEDVPLDVGMPEGYEEREINECLLIDEANEQGIDDKSWIAYILATARHETAGFSTLTEFADGCFYSTSGGHSDANTFGHTDPCDGPNYKGRGYVQVTWRPNYEKISDAVNDSDRFGNVDLVADPGTLSRDPEIAAFAIVFGMKEGTYTGRSLEDFGRGDTFNFEGARAIVNGRDKAVLIAGYAREYLPNSFPDCS